MTSEGEIPARRDMTVAIAVGVSVTVGAALFALFVLVGLLLGTRYLIRELKRKFILASYPAQASASFFQCCMLDKASASFFNVLIRASCNLIILYNALNVGFDDEYPSLKETIYSEDRQS